MKITNGKTELEINEKGAITQVSDALNKKVFFKARTGDERLFHIIVPIESWASRYIDLEKVKQPRIKRNSENVVLRYENLYIDEKQSGISAEVFFRTPPETDEIRISLKLTNKGAKNTVTGVIFPWINGWQTSSDILNDCVMLGPTNKFFISSLPRKCFAWGNGVFAQEHTVVYPTHVMLPWADISSEKGGVSIINYQREARQFYMSMKNMAGHECGYRIGVLFGFYPYVPAGAEWQSPEIGISVHRGDWHDTADRYREWYSGWLKPAESTRELKESIGSQHVFFSYFDGTPFRPYSSIPSIASDGRKYGVKELCVWERLSLGIYGAAYSKEEDLLKYKKEVRDTLKQAIDRAVSEGSDISALVNFRLLNPSLDVYKKEKLYKEIQIAYDGSPKIESYALAYIPGSFFTPFLGPYCNLLSPFSKKYRKRILSHIEEYLDLGFTSLFYDQPFETFPDYSRKNDGFAPDMVYAATLDIIRDVRNRLRKNNPNANIMGEQCDIFGSEIINQWMCWTWSDQDIEAAIRLHYALPYTIINCVIDRDIGLASHAFAAGLHLFLMTKAGTATLSDVPEFAAHIKKLAELKKRCAERIVHARFCHSAGISIDTDDKIVAYAYDSSKGPSVIIASPEKKGSAKITLHRDMFSNRGTKKGNLFCLDGSCREVDADIQTLQLEKGDVIVLTY